LALGRFFVSMEPEGEAFGGGEKLRHWGERPRKFPRGRKKFLKRSKFGHTNPAGFREKKIVEREGAGVKLIEEPKEGTPSPVRQWEFSSIKIY